MVSAKNIRKLHTHTFFNLLNIINWEYGIVKNHKVSLFKTTIHFTLFIYFYFIL